MKYIKIIFTVILIVLVIALIVQNHEAFSTEVTFKFNLFSVHLESIGISLYYIIPFSFLAGVILMGLYGITERFRFMKQIKTLKYASNEKDKELNSLRNLPITSENVGADLNGAGDEL